MKTKEFYFVRHGQTDHNLVEGEHKGDHLSHIPLNATGRAQAAAIEPLIASLPIQSICVSPMLRAKETKEISTQQLKAPHIEIEELGECTRLIWKRISQLKVRSAMPEEKEASDFIQQVKKGLHQALSHSSPTLIVSHGGVYWTTCWLLNIESHPWSIDNCGVVHFICSEDGTWKNKKL